MHRFHFITPLTARRLYGVDSGALEGPLSHLVAQLLFMLGLCLLAALAIAGGVALLN